VQICSSSSPGKRLEFVNALTNFSYLIFYFDLKRACIRKITFVSVFEDGGGHEDAAFWDVLFHPHSGYYIFIIT
jgi:hypothetical protein